MIGQSTYSVLWPLAEFLLNVTWAKGIPICGNLFILLGAGVCRGVDLLKSSRLCENYPSHHCRFCHR